MFHVEHHIVWRDWAWELGFLCAVYLWAIVELILAWKYRRKKHGDA